MSLFYVRSAIKSRDAFLLFFHSSGACPEGPLFDMLFHMEVQTNQNQYQQKKDDKQAAEAELKRQEKTKKIGKWLVSIGVLFLAGFFMWQWLAGMAPIEADRSALFADIGREHVPEGTDVKYNSNPPTSGPHYSEWAAEKFYDKEIPDGHVVHNLEHGDVWISYHPRVSSEVKEKLKKFAGSKVIITARSKNDSDIAVVVWARLDQFNIENSALDETRISDFIKRYVNRGPEKITGIPMGAREF